MNKSRQRLWLLSNYLYGNVSLSFSLLLLFQGFLATSSQSPSPPLLGVECSFMFALCGDLNEKWDISKLVHNWCCLGRFSMCSHAGGSTSLSVGFKCIALPHFQFAVSASGLWLKCKVSASCSRCCVWILWCLHAMMDSYQSVTVGLNRPLVIMFYHCNRKVTNAHPIICGILLFTPSDITCGLKTCQLFSILTFFSYPYLTTQPMFQVDCLEASAIWNRCSWIPELHVVLPHLHANLLFWSFSISASSVLLDSVWEYSYVTFPDLLLLKGNSSLLSSWFLLVFSYSTPRILSWKTTIMSNNTSLLHAIFSCPSISIPVCTWMYCKPLGISFKVLVICQLSVIYIFMSYSTSCPTHPGCIAIWYICPIPKVLIIFTAQQFGKLLGQGQKSVIFSLSKFYKEMASSLIKDWKVV